jgi:hypothetical protein
MNASFWIDLFIGTLNFVILTLILSFDDDGRTFGICLVRGHLYLNTTHLDLSDYDSDGLNFHGR